MELRPKDDKSLHNRVNDYLRGKPLVYAVEESDAAAIEAIFDQLQKAEEHLKAAQGRVERLQWELAKAKSIIAVEPQRSIV